MSMITAEELKKIVELANTVPEEDNSDLARKCQKVAGKQIQSKTLLGGLEF